jgi:hypothetical protein
LTSGRFALDSELVVGHRFNREKKQNLLHPHDNRKWTSGSPKVSIGESFRIAKETVTNRGRNLTIAA